MTAANPIPEGSAEAEIERLRAVLRKILLTSLLDVRRAAFSPTIGCRYNEAIRADIANACRRLEDVVLDGLEPPGGRFEKS